jgi:hypothetical protein
VKGSENQAAAGIVNAGFNARQAGGCQPSAISDQLKTHQGATPILFQLNADG